MPGPTPPPAWGTGPSWGITLGQALQRSKGLIGKREPLWQMAANQMSTADLLQNIANKMLGYVDPTTQSEIGSWLYRQSPTRWGAYQGQEGQAPPPPLPSAGGGQEYLDANRLRQAAAQLTSEGLMEGLPGWKKGGIHEVRVPERMRKFEEQYGSQLGWLRDFLGTAAQAYGTGVERASRGQQSFAGKRLAQLSQEAQGAGALAPFTDLAEKIVNPALARTSAAGGLGEQRAVSGRTPDEYKRAGVSARNPWAT